MSDLNGFDGIFQISEGFLIELTTVIENKFADAIMDGDEACPGVDIVDRIVEAVANRLVLIPRLLFATRNPAYTLDPNTGLTPIERRLKGHRNLGLLDEPPQPNRLVFLRDEFYTLDNPPSINFETNQIRITISGTAYLGRRFRTRAGIGPLENVRSGPFSMDLVYRVQVIDSEDKGLSFQRFHSVVDTLGARTPGNPTLPQCDMLVYALNNGTRRSPQWFLPPVDTQPEDLRRAGFHGEAGDQIWEQLTDAPRFEVQSRDVPLPSGNTTKRLFLIDKDGDVAGHAGVQCETDLDSSVAAKPRGGRISMIFDHVENLSISIPGESFSSSIPVIQNSLVRLNPFGLDVFNNVGRIPTELFSTLEVLGDHGLDVPLFPKAFPLSFDAEIMPGDTFVTSSSKAILFTDTKIIADDALILAGTLAGTGGNIAGVPSLLAFTGNPCNDLTGSFRADIATAISRRFVRDVFLDKIGALIKQKLEEKSEINAVTHFEVTFEDDGIHVSAEGNGTAEDAILWFDVDFTFSVKLPIHLCLQNAIARGKFVVDGETVRLPVDAWGEQIPASILTELGIVPPSFETADPNVNPICFMGYCDPAELPTPTLACTVDANAPVRYNPDGSERPPGPEEDRSLECRRQSDFAANVQLKHAKEIRFISPTEDEIDFSADVDLGILGFLLIFLLAVIAGIFTFGLGGLGVIIGVLSLIGIVLVIIVEVCVDILIGDTVTEKIADALASVTLPVQPTFDLHIGLVGYVVDMAAQSDSDHELGAMISRSRMIVEIQDERTGLEGFIDEC